MDIRVQAVRLEIANPFPIRLSCDGERNIVAKFLIPHCQKASREVEVPVPQTDTGRRGENPGDRENSRYELGKMTPNFGRRVLCCQGKPERAAVNRPRRLFVKTQVSAKPYGEV